MPTYDYRCKACGHELEIFQSMSEDPERRCPECKKLKLERLIGAGAGFIFKGSGFYETDYRSDSYTEGAKKDSESSSSSSTSGSDSGSSSDSKSSSSDSKAQKKPAKKAPKKTTDS